MRLIDLYKKVIKEAIARFPDSLSRRQDFVDSWWGKYRKSNCKWKELHKYGNGRRNRTGMI